MADDMPDADLGPKPDAQIEPGEPDPGGVDATPNSEGVDGESASTPVPADLDPDDNPAVEDVLPDEVKEGEDTSTEATESDGDDDTGTSQAASDTESPA